MNSTECSDAGSTTDPKFITLDLTSSGWRTESWSSLPRMRLPIAAEGFHATRDDLLEELRGWIGAHLLESEPTNFSLVLGTYTDLFLADLRMFDIGLRALGEILAAPKRIPVVVQTRSSLFALAVPLLRMNRDRLSIRFGLELPGSAQSSLVNPRFNERLELAKLIREIGLPVAAQVGMLASRISEARVADLRCVFGAYFDTLEVVPVEELFADEITTLPVAA